MKLKNILTIALVFILMLSLVMPVSAATYDMYAKQKINMQGNLCTIEYYAPDSIYQFAMIISTCKSNAYNVVGYNLIFYEAGTTFTYNNSAKTWSADQPFLYKTLSTYEEAKNELFLNKEATDYNMANTFANFTYGTVMMYQEIMYSEESNSSLENTYYNWYYEQNGEYPTIKDDSGEEDINSGGALSWLKGIFEGIGELIDTIGSWFQNVISDMGSGFTSLIEKADVIIENINPFNIIKLNNGTLLFDKAGELINENLKDNKFYTSLLSVRDTIKEILNEDYSSRTGFYELGLTTITLGKTKETAYIDFGNEVIGPWEQEYEFSTGKIDLGLENTKPIEIDWGLDNVKVINLDWYFGRDLGGGYYTKGMKPYIDGIISAFLWLIYAWSLYKYLPNWISGEITEIARLGTAPIEAYNESIVMKNKQIEFDKQKKYNNSYEAYKERMDRNAAYKTRYRNEKKGK